MKGNTMAETTKHTPGPWRFNPFCGTEADRKQAESFGIAPVHNCGNNGERYVSSEHGRIALVDSQIVRAKRGKNATPYDAPDAARDANARLIAAAPDLLAACQHAEAEFMLLAPYLTEPFKSAAASVRTELQAAIKRATP